MPIRAEITITMRNSTVVYCIKLVELIVILFRYIAVRKNRTAMWSLLSDFISNNISMFIIFNQ